MEEEKYSETEEGKEREVAAPAHGAHIDQGVTPIQETSDQSVPKLCQPIIPPLLFTHSSTQEFNGEAKLDASYIPRERKGEMHKVCCVMS